MKTDIQLEMGNCYRSNEYAIKKYLKTYDLVTGNYIPFNLYPKKLEIIRKHKTNSFNLIRKSRQVGGSSLIAAIAAIKLGIPNPYIPEDILAIHIRSDMGAEFIEKVRCYLKQLPREFWGDDYVGSETNLRKSIFLKNTRLEIILPNGSRMKSTGASRDVLCGHKPTWVIMDEAAFVEDGYLIYSSALSAISTDGSITLMSTPNGIDKLFYDTYAGSIKCENNFKVTTIKWYEDPRFNHDLIWVKDFKVVDEKKHTPESYAEMEKAGYKPSSRWYRDLCIGMNNNPRMIAQELDAQFV